MKKQEDELLAKSAENGLLSLHDHTQHVVQAAVCFAKAVGMDKVTARWAALIHDMGKAHPTFQKRVHGLESDWERLNPNKKPHRHEVSSLAFLPTVPKALWVNVFAAVVAHHKSLRHDSRGLGLYDLSGDRSMDYSFSSDESLISHHLDAQSSPWEAWHLGALEVLSKLTGLSLAPIARADAKQALHWALEQSEAACKTPGPNPWKGLLVAADHFASALGHGTAKQLPGQFKVPDWNALNKRSAPHPLYPLSMRDTSSPKPHTLVMAPTGAGKTEYLLRRTRGRVFYTLPFQASINAMFDRLSEVLAGQDVQVRLLHAASRLRPGQHNGSGGELEADERALQDKAGAGLKVLTPHQMMGLVMATRGYEALLMDVRGCDVILDEIHTYGEAAQAILFRLVEVLAHEGCRLHIGSATMPTALAQKVMNALGGEANVHIELLGEEELATYDRHTVHKLASWEDGLAQALAYAKDGKKVLVVCNRVAHAQAAFRELAPQLGDVEAMLIHSRYKRADRAAKEKQLMEWGKGKAPCLAVATQVVEVSLDISFDVMVTECAPLDALIQRFGRVNRKRLPVDKRKVCPVYVAPPPETATEAKPYSLDALLLTWAALFDGGVLHEASLQAKIDGVFPAVELKGIDTAARFRNGKYLEPGLCHQTKSQFIDLLDIDSASAIVESDVEAYSRPLPNETLDAFLARRSGMEIPIRVPRGEVARALGPALDKGSRPYAVNNKAYTLDAGLSTDAETMRPKGHAIL